MSPRFAAIATFLAISSVASAADPGWLGLSTSLETNSLMKVDDAVVKQVAKDSPAERAGITQGDAIVEVEGCRIPGCAAPKARGLMEPPAGKTVHLKLKHPDGQEYSVAIVAERARGRS